MVCGHSKHQFTQICNEAVIPGPGTGHSPSPSPIKYKLTYKFGEQWDNDDGSAGYSDIVLDIEMIFSYTDQEFEKLSLQTIATDEDICENNPDYTKPV